jgi:hypothetical protein
VQENNQVVQEERERERERVRERGKIAELTS